MEWEVEFTDEFETWWNGLDDDEQESVATVVGLLRSEGVSLRFPHSSGIQGSPLSHMRELRIQHHGDPYRVLYAFDPRRMAVLLIGGNKTGDDRWYDALVPKADDIYDALIEELEKEGRI